MKHIRFFAVFGILISILASCSFFSTKGDTGVIHIQLGASTARSMEDMREMFVFGSASIIISGPGMATRTITLSQEELLIPQSIEVPAGPNRRVQVYAKPDWEETQTYIELLYPDTDFVPPSLALAYGANALVEVKPNTSTNVNLKFELAETKILLPSYAGGGDISNLKTTDSFNGSVSDQHESFDYMIDSYTQFAFDRYGGMFFTFDDYIYYALNHEKLLGEDLGNGFMPTPLYYSVQGIKNVAYDRKNNRLFYNEPNNYTYPLSYLTVEEEFGDPVPITGLPEDYYYDSSIFTVDNDGNVYITASKWVEIENIQEAQEFYLLKIAVQEDNSAQVLETRTLSSYGLTDIVKSTYEYVDPEEPSYEEYYEYFTDTITDMIIRDGRLYLAANKYIHGYDIYIDPSQEIYDEENWIIETGRIAEIRLSDLALVRSYGGGETTPPDASSTRLFGPTRFLGFGPRKLYFSDEATYEVVEYVGEQPMYTQVNMNRLAELNLDTGAIQVRPVDEESEAYFFKSTGY